MATKIDTRFIDFPNEGGSVYVVKDGVLTPANVVDMTDIWSPSINDEEIVLAVDEDMTPYQLTGNNAEVKGMFLTEYDQKKVLEQERRDVEYRVASDMLKERLPLQMIAKISKLSEEAILKLAKKLGIAIA